MKIILDEREVALYTKCVAANSPCHLEKRVLPLGDILITRDDDTVLLMLERKTLSDLLASIKDGRYEEQSYRLIHSSNMFRHHIVYIIEGIVSQLRSPQEKKRVYSAITSLQVFKGFSVLRTSSVQETADLILDMTDKIGRDLNKGKTPWIVNETIPSTGGGIDPADYCTVVKKVKKENITVENIGEIMLCQIPGVSAVSAKAIMLKYKTLAELILVLKENPSALEGTTYVYKDKTRKVSKTILRNIVSFLM